MRVAGGLSGANLSSTEKLTDLVMRVLTGEKERSTEEYRGLMARGGFQLNKVVPTEAGFVIIEAIPA